MSEEAGPSERAGSLAEEAQGKAIHCQDGPVGRVTDVLVDPVTGQPQYLVWREAVLVTKEVSIPIGYIERIEDDDVILHVERDAIERLPHFWTADLGGKENDAAGT